MRMDLLWEMLPVLGYGMAGVFLVTGAIIACVAGLNRIFRP